MKYTTVDRIFNKLNRDIALETINEADIIEWMGEALDAIKTKRHMEEAVAFLEVKNYKTELPHNLHNIIQVARNNNYNSFSDATPTTTDEVLTEETNYPVYIDPAGLPYGTAEIAYYRPYYDLKYDYELWRNNTNIKRCYTPVRLSTSVFFNSIVCSENNTDCNLYAPTEDEYTIIKGSVLRLSFEEGLIAISYTRSVQSNDGIPMVPDTYSVTTAITKYITMKIMERNFYLGKEGYERKAATAAQDWQWYCKQAINEGKMPQTIDEHENLVRQSSYLIPRRKVYDNFFGNLGRRDVKNLIRTNKDYSDG